MDKLYTKLNRVSTIFTDRMSKAVWYMKNLKSFDDETLKRAYIFVRNNPYWDGVGEVNAGLYTFVRLLNNRYKSGFTANQICRIVVAVANRREIDLNW